MREMRERLFELVGKTVGKVIPLASRLSGGRTVDVVIDHEIPGVTAEMVDWWWRNMSDPERYRLWHPKDHIWAVWETSPEEDPLRPTQLALEKVGGVPALMRLRVMQDPDAILERRTYAHAMGGYSLDGKGRPFGSAVHEYEDGPGGVLKMRTTFKVPARAPEIFKRMLRKHCREEMSQLPYFLPRLYAESACSRQGPAC